MSRKTRSMPQITVNVWEGTTIAVREVQGHHDTYYALYRPPHKRDVIAATKTLDDAVQQGKATDFFGGDYSAAKAAGFVIPETGASA